ncbi:MAG: pseudouridine synthase [Holophagales bacterium]|nr:pseudouridine synthase [Holophagales bacterium]
MIGPGDPSGRGFEAIRHDREDPRHGFEVLHHDADLLAVSKPSGLAVHRGWAAERDVALVRARSLVGRRVYPVHRLDRGTSGVLLFALSPERAAQLQARLAGGPRREGLAAADKRYLALVRGIPDEEGTIDHPVPRRRKSKERVRAVTDYRRLGVFERFSLVEARPHTGRTHQIRRHMKHRSWPIVGDVHYGRGEINRRFRREFGLHRLALHALSLELDHPGTGERLRLVAPLPPDLAVPLEAMGFGPVLAEVLSGAQG